MKESQRTSMRPRQKDYGRFADAGACGTGVLTDAPNPDTSNSAGSTVITKLTGAPEFVATVPSALVNVTVMTSVPDCPLMPLTTGAKPVGSCTTVTAVPGDAVVTGEVAPVGIAPGVGFPEASGSPSGVQVIVEVWSSSMGCTIGDAA